MVRVRTTWPTHYHYDPIAFTGTLLPSPVITCGLLFHLLFPQQSSQIAKFPSFSVACVCLSRVASCQRHNHLLRNHQTSPNHIGLAFHPLQPAISNSTPWERHEVRDWNHFTDLQIPWDSEILRSWLFKPMVSPPDKTGQRAMRSKDIKRCVWLYILYILAVYESMIDSPWISRHKYRWSWAQETFFNELEQHGKMSQTRHKQANLQWSSNALQTSPSAEHSWCTCA